MSAVDVYIESFEGEVKEHLNLMRNMILALAPDAEESISYGMPAFKLHGKPLVYFAGYKKHVGFYATPAGHKAFKNELSKYKQGKGSVQFPNDEKLPLDLIKRIILFRIDENFAKLKE